MKIQLSPTEARMIGVLLEKQVTTPDQYPLSLNGVVIGCNQKSSREPVMNLTETDVQNVLDELVKRHLLRTVSGFGNRVTKYEQRLCNSEFGNLKFNQAEIAVMTTLLLRGPQTPGELRSRSSRLHEFADASDLDTCLERLASREDGPFIARLSREPGKRESRYRHLLCGDELPEGPDEAPPASLSALETRVEALEIDVAELNARVAALTGNPSV